MNVVLIGFSGTGKSTVGRAVATLLGWPFVDTDAEVQHAVGKPIHRIFAEDGEKAFRALEAEAVARALSSAKRVVALGGGAVMRPANREIVSAGNLVVLLDASADTIVGRLTQSREREPRPVVGIGTGGDAEALGRVLAVKQEREPVYRHLADLVVETDGAIPSAIAARIVEAVRFRAVGGGNDPYPG